MNIENIFKNIETQNKLRKALHIKELAIVGKFTYKEKKEYKTFKSFLKDLNDEYISSFVTTVLDATYNLDELYIEIDEHTFYIKEVE